MKNILAAKIIEGFHSQDWQALGRGGTWAGAMRPLEAYVNRKIERAVKAERKALVALVYEMDGPDGIVPTDDLLAAIRVRGQA